MTLREVAAVAAGGVIGATTRHGLLQDLPGIWTTWGINVGGCLLIGALMALVEAGRAPGLARLFLGVGVLGGFTTFSTAMVDTQGLIAAGERAAAAAHLVGTPVVAVAAAWAGSRLVRAGLR